jgi:hypothetical protein
MPGRDPVKVKEYKHKHYLENIEKYKNRARQSELRNPDKQKINYLKHREERIKKAREYVLQ